MLNRIVLFLVSFVVLLLAVAFAALNPGVIDVDLGLFDAQLQKSLALILSFAIGWLFGMSCLALVLFRMILERRRLRKALRLAETEVQALRSMPATDAD